MNQLLESIDTKSKLTQESHFTIIAKFETTNLKKGDLLLREGMTCQHLYFISSGVARSFYYHNEKEITSWFYKENQWLSSWYSFYSQLPSFEYIEVLEDVNLYKITYSSYQELMAENVEFNTFGRILAEEQVAFLDYFSKGFSFMSAKEKYDLLLNLFPNVSMRVNLGHIASFLGITQETLSRIRKKR